MAASYSGDNPTPPPITFEPLNPSNWMFILSLGVRPDQQRFMEGLPSVSSLAMGRPQGGPPGAAWRPLLIRAGGTPAGFCALATYDGSTDEIWLYHYFIDQRRQGEGLGTAALAALLAYVRGLPEGFRRVRINVHRENLVARDLYLRAGFDLTGEDGEDGEGEILSLEL